MKYTPHDYQTRATNFILEHPKAGMLLEMGLGKTVITMTAIDILINEMFEVDRVLVIAPKRVAEDTWTREHAKWDHLRHLRVSKVLGPPEQRRRALVTDADIYVIGRDNVVWLVDLYQKLKTGWPFDMIVIDELSSFKNPQAKRFRALRKVMPKVSRVVGLTGTPSANGLMDLWAEIYLLDRGERLGQTLGAYREKYFRPGARNGYIVFKWEPLRGAREKIEAAISDICISMSAADYLKLPKRIDNRIPVKLSPQEMKQYKTMEAEQLLHIDDEDVVALNAAAVMTKLLQIANGSVYSHEGNAVPRKRRVSVRRQSTGKIQKDTQRKIYAAALQRSWRDGPGAALGDDTESGDETFEACGDRGCPYGLRCDGSTDGNRGSAAESIYL